MWKIGNVVIKSQIGLAPMAGVSNPAYMKICEEMGVGWVVTELISSEAIIRDNQKTKDMLKGLDALKIPYGIQLFGSNPRVMGDAAKIIYDEFKPDFIDINMGCPVPKVAVKSGAGSALLKDADKVYEIVASVKEAVSCPVTVKMRSGWDDKNINAVQIAKICEKAGASAITIHGRTRAQGYMGKADWNIIKLVKESVSVPVIGNGDIVSPELAKKMLLETGCDAVMIGRGALGNPWLIRDAVHYLETGTIPETPSLKEKFDMLKKHYQHLHEFCGEKVALLEIRSNAIWYLKGMPKSAEIKNKICSAKSSKEIFDILEEYYNTCL